MSYTITPSTILQETATKLKVIWKVVLLEASKLNDF